MVQFKILVIDNYDSFTFNLVQYLYDFTEDIEVVRNDKVDLKQIEIINPGYIVISPGPGTPDKAGICLDLIRKFAGRLPILGVCLGHQSIASAFKSNIARLKRVLHGKTSLIYHDGKGIFAGIPSPFKAVRYHSLVVAPENLPACLEVSAWTETGEIMGLRHKRLAYTDTPLDGVQFHPESVLTEYGKELIANYIEKVLPLSSNTN